MVIDKVGTELLKVFGWESVKPQFGFFAGCLDSEMAGAAEYGPFCAGEGIGREGFGEDYIVVVGVHG
jgi:hypothetical protein